MVLQPWAKYTINQEIFTFKNFCGVKLSCGFVQSANFLWLTITLDKCLENSLHLVYYQVSGEPGITGCSC